MSSTETVQAAMLRLEKVVLSKQHAIEDLKEKLCAAQEERFRAYQELSSFKEQYLVNAVNNLQNRLSAKQPESTESTSTETRVDNLEVKTE